MYEYLESTVVPLHAIQKMLHSLRQGQWKGFDSPKLASKPVVDTIDRGLLFMQLLELVVFLRVIFGELTRALNLRLM